MHGVRQNIPALRFPEFGGKWDERKLEGDVELISGQHLNPDEYSNRHGKIPYFSGPSDFTNNPKNVGKWGLKIRKVAQRADILFTVKGSGVGTQLFLDLDRVVIGRQLMAIRSSHSSTNFISQFLSTKTHYYQSLAKGNLIPGLTRQDILFTLLHFPKKLEQQKIANFLTAVDEKIVQLSKKKALLEQYKKGVMQKLFSQSIRFTDDNGSPYPNWEEKKLDEALYFLNTNSLSRRTLNYKGGHARNIHYGDIHTKFPVLLNANTKLLPYINNAIDISKIREDNYCQIGDIVIADASEDYADIGKTLEIIKLPREKLLAGLHTLHLRSKGTKFAIGFLGYLMQSQDVRKQIMRIAQGISVLGISKTNTSKIILNTPHHKEQQKIADFLSAIDDKITAVSSQLHQAKTFKKGLLQQMFV